MKSNFSPRHWRRRFSSILFQWKWNDVEDDGKREGKVCYADENLLPSMNWETVRVNFSLFKLIEKNQKTVDALHCRAMTIERLKCFPWAPCCFSSVKIWRWTLHQCQRRISTDDYLKNFPVCQWVDTALLLLKPSILSVNVVALWIHRSCWEKRFFYRWQMTEL